MSTTSYPPAYAATAILVPCSVDLAGRVRIVDVHGQVIEVPHAEDDVRHVRRRAHVELVAFDSRADSLCVALPAGGSAWIRAEG